MKRRLFLRAALGAAFSILALTGSAIVPAQAQGRPTLTVSAAASMKDALTEINARYSAAIIRVNYGASGALQRQIENGAPVDAFISAATKNMDELQRAHLVDGATRRNIAANQLVLIVPSSSRGITSFRDLNTAKVKRFAMGATRSVPAGQYAQQVLTNIGIYNVVVPKAVLGKDVREVLTQVELGNVDAGIVYRSDALKSRQTRIVATAPVHLHKPIAYPAAVVSDSRNKPAAAAYVRFLASAQSQSILRKYGFQTPRP